MKLEGKVPVGYRGVPDHGQDWLERAYFTKLSGPGFVVTLAGGILMFNGVVVVLPHHRIVLPV